MVSHSITQQSFVLNGACVITLCLQTSIWGSWSLKDLPKEPPLSRKWQQIRTQTSLGPKESHLPTDMVWWVLLPMFQQISSILKTWDSRTPGPSQSKGSPRVSSTSNSWKLIKKAEPHVHPDLRNQCRPIDKIPETQSLRQYMTSSLCFGWLF